MPGLLVEKKERENSRQLAGRFVRAIRRSGLIYGVKKSKFWDRPLSHASKKKAALRKAEIKRKRQKLEKLGKA